MANEYDSIVDNLYQKNKVPDAIPAASEGYDDIVDQSFSPNKQSLKQSTFAAEKKDPERMAEALKISKQINMPAFFVEKNLDKIKENLQGKGVDTDDLVKNHPGLAKWSERPENASIAKDDYDTLKKATPMLNRIKPKRDEPYFRPLKENIASGFLSLKSGAYMLSAAQGTVSIEDVADEIVATNKKIQSYRDKRPVYMQDFDKILDEEIGDVNKAWKKFTGSFDKLSEGHILDGLSDFASGAIETPIEAFDVINETLIQRPKETSLIVAESAAFSVPTLAAGAGGAAAGTAVAPGIGTLVGGVGGTFTAGAVTEASAYISQALTERGYDVTDRDSLISAFKNPKLMTDVKGEAYRKGITTAGVDTVFMAFGGKVAGRAARNAGRAAKPVQKVTQLGLESVGEGAGEFAGQAAAKKDFSQANLGESIFEGVAGLGQSLGQTVIFDAPVAAGKKVLGKDGVDTEADVSSPDVNIEQQQELATARKSYPDNPVEAAKQLTLDYKEVQMSVTEMEAADKLIDIAIESKTQTRSKEAFESFINEADSGDMPREVYAQADDFDDYISSRGESPVDKAEELLGVSAEEYYKAKEDGKPLKANLGKVVNSIADNPDYRDFMQIAKSRPEGYSMMEADQILRQAPNLMKQIANEAVDYKARLDDDNKAAREASKNIAQGLRDAGRNPKAAVFYEEGLKTLAKRLNLPVSQVIEQYGLSVKAGEGDAAGSNVFNQEEKAAFYSKLEKTVNEKIQGKSATVDQVRALVKENQKEAEFLGLEEFLSDKKKVSKEELVEFIRDNSLNVQEIALGEPNKSYDRHIVKDADGMKLDEFARKEDAQAYIDEIGEGYGAYIETINEVYSDTPTKFGEYTLPGGENYREVLFTLPPEDSANLDELESRRKNFESLEKQKEDDTKKQFKALESLKSALAEEGLASQAKGIANKLRFSSDIRKTEKRNQNQEKAFQEVVNEMPTDELKSLAQDFGDSYAASTVSGFRAFLARSSLEELEKTERKNVFKSSHYDEENILAHVRLNDRIDSEGNKVLFVEEIQSDWHQVGRKKGYQGDGNLGVKDLPPEVNIIPYEEQPGKFIAVDVTNFKDLNTISNTEDEAAAKFIGKRDNRVPDAPFKKNWHEFAFKRVADMAVRDGYDKIAWTTGEQQAERYDLSKQIDTINYGKIPKDDSAIWLRIYDKNANLLPLDSQGFEVYKSFDDENATTFKVPKDSLEDVIGKEMAKKITEGEGEKYSAGGKAISGDGLKVGGEGMKGFYDKMLVSYANKFGKKFDAKVGQTEVASGDTVSKVHSIPVTKKMKEKILGEGQTLFQKEKGRIKFSPKLNDNVIELMATADESTFIHEMGHYFLEIYKDIYQNDNAPLDVKQDFDAILNWLGVDNPNEIKREHHEKWARGFEAYVREGKAPTSELRKAFNQFKTYLINVYKNVLQLDVELSDDIRQVMGRMLGADNAINEAQFETGDTMLFPDPIESGMTENQASEYYSAMSDARSTTEEELMKTLMRQLDKRRTRLWKKEKKEITNRVLSDLTKKDKKDMTDDELYYVAFAALSTGKNPDGSAFPDGTGKIKIRKSDILEKKSKNFLTNLPRPLVYTTKAYGYSSDEVAIMFGLPYDGEALLDNLFAMPTLDAYVDNIAEQELAAKYGDLLASGNIKEEAERLLHNTDRAKRIRLEYEHLAKNKKGLSKEIIRRVTRRPIPDKVVKQNAKNVIDEIKVGEIDAYSYKLAERRYAKEAGKSLANGDIQAAFEHKQKELFNHYLYSFATDAKQKVAKEIKNSKKFFASDKELAKTRDMDVVNAGRAILARYGMGRSDKLPLEYLSSIKEYNPEGYEMISAMISELLVEPDNFKNISYQKFVDLSDAVNALWSIAKMNKEVEIEGKKILIQDAVDNELIPNFQKRLDKKNKGKTFDDGLASSMSEKEKLGLQLLSLKGWLTTTEAWVDTMDFGKFDGPVRKYLYQQISDRVDEFQITYNDYKKKYAELSKPIAEKINYKESIAANEIGFKFKNKSELLGAILHTGNESNLKKLLVGRGWGTLNEDGSLNDTRWKKFIERMYNENIINKEDMDYVQSLWDLMEGLKPLSQNAYKKVYGMYYNEIQSAPIETPFGTYKGGYAPAAIDRYAYEKLGDKKELEQFLQENGHYIHPTSGGGGWGKSRVENFNKPLSLELSLVPKHIEEVLRFSIIKPAVIDSYKILLNKDFESKLKEVDPAAKKSVLVPAYNRADKNTTQGEDPNTPSIARTLSGHIKSAASMQIMFANIVNIVEQVSGLVVSTTKVKPRSLARAGFKYLSNPHELAKNIREISPGMRVRSDTQLVEFEKHSTKIFEEKSNLKTMREWSKSNAYIGQIMFQNQLDNIVFTAAYDEAIQDGMKADQAAKHALSIVRLSMTSTRAFDVSGLSSNQWLNFFQMFMNFFNQMVNLNVANFTNLYYSDLSLKQKFSKGLYLYTMGFASLAAISAALRKAAAGGLDEDDDDEYLDDLYDVFIGSQIDLGLAMIPIVGSAVNAGINRVNDKFYDDKVSASPAISVISTGVGVISKAATGKLEGKKRDINDTLMALGIVTGIPLRPAGKPIGYLIDVQQGNARPTGPVDFTRGIITGKPGVR